PSHSLTRADTRAHRRARRRDPAAAPVDAPADHRRDRQVIAVGERRRRDLVEPRERGPGATRALHQALERGAERPAFDFGVEREHGAPPPERADPPPGGACARTATHARAALVRSPRMADGARRSIRSCQPTWSHPWSATSWPASAIWRRSAGAPAPTGGAGRSVPDRSVRRP